MVVRFGGYMFIGIRLSTILKSMFENYGYGIELALLRLYKIPWRLVKCDRYKPTRNARNL